MDDARHKADDCQHDIDEEVLVSPHFKEGRNRRQDDRENDENDLVIHGEDSSKLLLFSGLYKKTVNVDGITRSYLLSTNEEGGAVSPKI